MRMTELEATVQILDPKSGQCAVLEMKEVELENIGFGCRGDGANAYSVFQLQGNVAKNKDGRVQFKSLPSPGKKSARRRNAY